MGHPGARGGGPCPGEHRPQSQCTVMGWDMFPIALAIQNSYPMSHSSCNSNILARFQPICFPGRGPFAQGGCRGLARGAGHERSLPVEGRALQRLQGGSPHICCMDGLEKQKCIVCLVAECFKGSAGSLAAHSPQGFGLDTKAAGQAANICLQCLTHCRQKKKHITTGRRSSMGVQRLVNLMKAAGGHDSPRQC